MNHQKNDIDYSKIHSNHYNLLANLRKVPWITSASLLTLIRSSIVIYTMLYMAFTLTDRELTPECLNKQLFLLRALYYLFFPLSTILTSIEGVDMLYILHLLLLSFNMEFFEVVYNDFSEPGFEKTYSIISIALGLVNLIFFFYWSIPNRLLFINTFQIGVTVKAQTPYNVLKRIGIIWLIGSISLVIFTLVISFWNPDSDHENAKHSMYMESEPYFRFVIILIIEYLIYKQFHPLYKYKLKDLIDYRAMSNISYISMIIFFFLYFCTISILWIFGFGLEFFVDNNETIQIVNLLTQAIFSVRFYFLWNLSTRDLLEESGTIDNNDPDYPQWSWDWVQTNPIQRV